MKTTTIAARSGLMLLLCLFCQGLFSPEVYAQNCKTGFTFMVKDTTVNFFVDSANRQNKIYEWNFGNGYDYYNYFRPQVIRDYAHSGNYNVCLKVRDTITNCRDSFCTKVEIKICKANFISSRFNNSIRFYNYSLKTNAKYSWDFGDSSASNKENPTHVYSKGGTYLVTLVMQDTIANCADTFSNYVYPRDVLTTCKPTFNYNVYSNYVYITNTSDVNESTISFLKFENGDTVRIKNEYSYIVPKSGKHKLCLITKDTVTKCTDTFCTDIIATFCEADFSYTRNGNTFNFTNKSSHLNSDFYWNFGDGKSSTDVNPQHDFTGSGPFYVSLQMNNNNNNNNNQCVDTVWKRISLCSSSYTYTTKGTIAYLEADSVTLVNKSYYWSGWSFNNNPKPVLNFMQPGIYRFCLFVYDSVTNCRDSFCNEIEVVSCKASFTASRQNNSITFSNHSYKSNNRVYSWDFGDSTTSDQENPVHTYAKGGTYLVTLIMKDTVAGCADTFSANVYPLDLINTCHTEFSATVNGYEVDIASKSILNESAKSFINFGNGDLPVSISKNLKYKFAHSGSYNVCMISNDSFINCTDTFCTIVEIKVCKADFIFTREGNTFSFTNTSSYPAADFHWDFGDGKTSDSINPQHAFSGDGPYEITLVMTNTTTNCVDTVKKVISSCKAAFSYTLEGKKITFHDSSAVVNGGIYYWKFLYYSPSMGQDIRYSNQKNPVEYFLNGVQVRVVLIVRDSLNTCLDSTVKIIWLPSCEATFGYKQDFENIKFNNYTQDKGNCNFTWDFGDSTTSNQESPVHKYKRPGVYNVSLIMSNRNTLCTDTTVQNVYVENSACYNDFWYNISGNAVSFFPDTFYYYGYNNFAAYHWDFGDGNSSTLTAPKHDYLKTGKYKVCLTVTGAFCSTKKYIDVNVVSMSPTYSITGQVYIGSAITDSAGIDAYLIKFNPQDSTLNLVDSFLHNFTRRSYHGAYSFQNLLPGKYLVKAALRKVSPQYTNYLPTYADTSLRWENAKELTVTNTNVQADIRLRAGNNPGGKGFISGKVSQGANKREGDPLENILVMLLDENLQPVTYTYSDAGGNFSFSNIPIGKLLVYTEVIGVKTISTWVTLTEENPKEESVEVKVSRKIIITSIGTKNDIPASGNISIFPNPVQNQLTVAIDAPVARGAKLIIFDNTGRKIITETIAPVVGPQTININTSQLPAGVYLMQLQFNNNDQTRQFKFVK